MFPPSNRSWKTLVSKFTELQSSVVIDSHMVDWTLYLRYLLDHPFQLPCYEDQVIFCRYPQWWRARQLETKARTRSSMFPHLENAVPNYASRACILVCFPCWDKIILLCSCQQNWRNCSPVLICPGRARPTGQCYIHHRVQGKSYAIKSKGIYFPLPPSHTAPISVVVLRSPSAKSYDVPEAMA